MSNHAMRSIVTFVEQQKKRKNRYNIYLNDTYAFSVHEDVLVKHRLFKGLEVDEEQLQEVLKDEELQQAYLQAIRMLSRKPRSEKEIEIKLREKQFDERIITQTIFKLEEQKYINDMDYAKILTSYRIQSQKKGRKWIIQELNQKGIAKEHIDQAIVEIDEMTEYQNAYEIARKKWDRDKGSVHDKIRRTGGLLLRRGYTNSVVQQVLRNLQNNKDDVEDS